MQGGKVRMTGRRREGRKMSEKRYVIPQWVLSTKGLVNQAKYIYSKAKTTKSHGGGPRRADDEFEGGFGKGGGGGEKQKKRRINQQERSNKRSNGQDSIGGKSAERN